MSVLWLASQQLDDLGQRLEKAERRAEVRWERSAADAEAPLGGETLFADAKRAVGAGLRKLCTLLGERVAFTDLKPLLGDRIYLPTPSASDLRPVLVELDQKLLPAVVGAVGCADADAQALRSLVVAEIFAACVRALLAAILSGRPRRSFAPSDEAIVDHDLYQLQELFLARRGGSPTGEPQGVSLRVAEQATRPLRRLLPLLGASSDELVTLWEGGRAGAAARPSASLDVLPRAALPPGAAPAEQQQPTEAQLEALEQQQQQQRITQVLLSRPTTPPRGGRGRTRAPGSAAPRQTPETSLCSVCRVWSVYNRISFIAAAQRREKPLRASARPLLAQRPW